MKLCTKHFEYYNSSLVECVALSSMWLTGILLAQCLDSEIGLSLIIDHRLFLSYHLLSFNPLKKQGVLLYRLQELWQWLKRLAFAPEHDKHALWSSISNVVTHTVVTQNICILGQHYIGM